MNRLHVVARVQEMVLEGASSPGEIWRQTKGMFLPPDSIEATVGLKRTEVEDTAKKCIEAISQAKFPCERRRFELDIAEARVRADVLDALATIDLGNPSIAREVYSVHNKVGSSAGRPTLEEALHILEGAGKDITGLRTALSALYPSDADDAGDEAAVPPVEVTP